MLEQLLTELRDKIDEDYADRIDKVTTNIKTVDNLEARAIERIDTINAVIQWAQNYEVDSARLTAADALAEAARVLLEDKHDRIVSPARLGLTFTEWSCLICGAIGRDKKENVNHADDCVIVLARNALHQFEEAIR